MWAACGSCATSPFKSVLKKDFKCLFFVAAFQTDAVPAPDVQLSILHNWLRDAESVTEKRKIVKDIVELLQVR